MRSSVARRDRDGTAAQCLGIGIRFSRALAEAGQRADHAFPGIEALGRLTLAAEMLGRVELRFDRRDDTLGDLVLHRENVDKIAVVTLRPDMIAGFGLDQLCGDAQPIAALADAAFE